MMKLSHYLSKKNKGQSFLEMTIVLGVLLLLVVGMAEFGNLLNQYINLVDAVREGARFGSNNDPFLYTNEESGATWYDYSTPNPTFFEKVDTIIEGDIHQDAKQRTSALSPLVLDPLRYGDRSNGEKYLADDVLISFFAVSGKSIMGRYPSSPWSRYGSGQVSKISDQEIKDQLDGDAPSTGILLVEIFYNYHQMLNFPFFTAIIPNPVSVHVYSFMPLAGAEATPTPCPGGVCP